MPADRNRPDRRRPVRPGPPTAEILEPRLLLATITVNTTGDADGATGGTTLSLRQAIEISNGTFAFSALSPGQAKLVVGPLGTPNTIDFAIPGDGPLTIAPATSLPAITSPVLIDGYSQPGARPNTGGPGLADDAVLRIELSGAALGPASEFGNGLDLMIGGNTVQGLAIGGFSQGAGISLPLGDPGNVIRGDFIGTDVMGLTGLGNGTGVSGGFASTIGGTAAADRNVISGNRDGFFENVGILLYQGRDLVEGNFIGADSTGTRSLPNTAYGIDYQNFYLRYHSVTSSPDPIPAYLDETIGGTAAGAGNVISGNGAGGIYLSEGEGFSASVSSLVQGNLIGTDVTGTKALGNGGGGIDVDGPVTIGGTVAAAGNVISGNAGVGLILENSGDLVQGNLIGTDATGTKPLGNAGVGVDAQATDTIGGAAYGAGNLIGGNLGAGITLEGTGDLVQGNFVGTDVTGTRALGNAGDGVEVSGTSDIIGGTYAGNIIADNRGDGASILIGFAPVPYLLPTSPSSGQYDTVSGNSIFANDGLGIDLLDVAGSLRHVDMTREYFPIPLVGGNGLLAPPVIQSASSGDSGAVIKGTLSGTPSTTFTIELFVDPTGSGQGKTFFGLTFATTDAAGHASFGFASEAAPISIGQYVTATATNPKGNTSEFAKDLLFGDSRTTTTLVGPGPLARVSQPLTFAAAVAPNSNGVPTGTVTFTDDGGPNGIPIGTATLDGSGVAALVTDKLSLGPHSIRATYLGDSNHRTSQSGAVPVTVLRRSTTTTLIGPGAVAVVGQSLAFAAVVAPTATGVPTGTVAFTDGGTLIGISPLNSSGVAVLLTNRLSPGSHAIQATYLGDSTRATSPSQVIAVTIARRATTTTLAGPTGLSLTGQPLTFAASVAPTPLGIPTGMVAFTDGGVPLATVPIDASGNAIFITSGLAPGEHFLQATYLGDAANTPSISGNAPAGVLPSIAFGGPAVTAIVSSNLSSITITFSRPLMAGPAQDVANYAIVGPDGRAVAVESATYDPIDDSVTLETGRPLKPHRTYRVLVDGRRAGGVVDAYGIALAGDHGGVPGGRHQGTVTTGGAAHAAKHHMAAPKHPKHPPKTKR